jgi:putative addiction module component (TIGR02574 family)
MPATVEEIVAQVERLSPAERDRLVERLLSAPVAADAAVDAAWKLEVERRVDEAERGEDDALPWEQVRKELGLA